MEGICFVTVDNPAETTGTLSSSANIDYSSQGMSRAGHPIDIITITGIGNGSCTHDRNYTVVPLKKLSVFRLLYFRVWQTTLYSTLQWNFLESITLLEIEIASILISSLRVETGDVSGHVTRN